MYERQYTFKELRISTGSNCFWRSPDNVPNNELSEEFELQIPNWSTLHGGQPNISGAYADPTDTIRLALPNAGRLKSGQTNGSLLRNVLLGSNRLWTILYEIYYRFCRRAERRRTTCWYKEIAIGLTILRGLEVDKGVINYLKIKISG